MKTSMIVIILFALCFSATGQVREVSLTNDVEIKWGDGAWEPLIIDSAVFTPGTIPTDEITSGLLGLQRFEAEVNAGEICKVTFTLASIPVPRLFWGQFIRVRWRYRIATLDDPVVSVWSEESNAKAIINLSSPGKPVW